MKGLEPININKTKNKFGKDTKVTKENYKKYLSLSISWEIEIDLTEFHLFNFFLL